MKFPLLLSLCLALLTACVCAPVTSLDALAAEVSEARQVLLGYFSALSDGRYAEASARYGGNYEVLQSYNPNLPEGDHAALFERACTANGFMCLEVLEVIRQEVISANEFQIVVRFANPDGSLFVRGPCCGASEEEMPAESEFAYSVRRVGERFFVADLPVYLP
jgi:hypothetical protein